MSEVKVAKLFRNGGSQAVRLPAEFRFEGDEVYVRRDEATGDVVLSTNSPASAWQELFAEFDSHDIPPEERDEFARIMDEVVAGRRGQPDPATTRRAFWEGFFARLDTGRVEDEHFDAYMTERPMNAPIQHRDIFGDDE